MGSPDPHDLFLGVFPKNCGEKPPKWMVKIMENPIKIHDLEGFPLFLGNTQIAKKKTNIRKLRFFPPHHQKLFGTWDQK